MKKLRFYGRQQSTLAEMLPRLLEKVVAQGLRSVVLFDNQEQLTALDASLWTYSPLSFLPHGTKKDGAAEDQPIWLTTILENPNDSQTCVLTCPVPHIWEKDMFQQYIYLFDLKDADDVATAKNIWAQQKNTFETGIWRQDDAGKWSEIASFDKI